MATIIFEVSSLRNNSCIWNRTCGVSLMSLASIICLRTLSKIKIVSLFSGSLKPYCMKSMIFLRNISRLNSLSSEGFSSFSLTLGAFFFDFSFFSSFSITLSSFKKALESTFFSISNSLCRDLQLFNPFLKKNHRFSLLSST